MVTGKQKISGNLYMGWRANYMRLLNDHDLATILTQFIYWTREDMNSMRRQFEKIRQRRMEKELFADIDELGWIDKTAAMIIDDLTMWDVSKATMNRWLEKLVARGYLERKKNGAFKGDISYSYRVCIEALLLDLHIKNLAFPDDEFENAAGEIVKTFTETEVRERAKFLETVFVIKKESKRKIDPAQNESTQIEFGAPQNESGSAQIESGATHSESSPIQNDSDSARNEPLLRRDIQKEESKEEFKKNLIETYCKKEGREGGLSLVAIMEVSRIAETHGIEAARAAIESKRFSRDDVPKQ